MCGTMMWKVLAQVVESTLLCGGLGFESYVFHLNVN